MMLIKVVRNVRTRRRVLSRLMPASSLTFSSPRQVTRCTFVRVALCTYRCHPTSMLDQSRLSGPESQTAELSTVKPVAAPWNSSITTRELGRL